MLGLSLGESAGLFGMRIWTDRDEMFRRIALRLCSDRTWPAVRRGPPALNLDSVDWVSGLLSASADDVNSRLRPH